MSGAGVKTQLLEQCEAMDESEIKEMLGLKNGYLNDDRSLSWDGKSFVLRVPIDAARAAGHSKSNPGTATVHSFEDKGLLVVDLNDEHE